MKKRWRGLTTGGTVTALFPYVWGFNPHTRGYLSQYIYIYKGCGKQIASYIGLVPEEKSSGDRRRLGHISKQGNVLLRFLLVEAAQVTVRSQPQWRSKFFHLAMRRGRKIAKVAMARKLAVHLYWMWRQGRDYGQTQKFGSQGRKLSSHTVVTKSSTR